MQLVSLEDLVKQDHPYRRLLKLIDFKELTKPLKKLERNQEVGSIGFGIERNFKCLLLQFMEDLSDRELERYLSENTSAKFFCGFDILDQTPDYSLFSKLRKKIGTKNLSLLFGRVRDSLKSQGLITEIFTFVDASHLISKANLWEERDKSIKAKIDKLNNETLPKVAVDKQAKIGCKGKKKFWYGYKRHTSVDMQSGLINKVAATPANTTDAQGMQHVCPDQGAVYADKGYCTQDATNIIKAKGCHNATIKKNNMKVKNKDKDSWISAIRSPYERVFSKVSKRSRYRGIAKNQWQVTFEALAFNFKRLMTLGIPKIELVG